MRLGGDKKQCLPDRRGPLPPLPRRLLLGDRLKSTLRWLEVCPAISRPRRSRVSLGSAKNRNALAVLFASMFLAGGALARGAPVRPTTSPSASETGKLRREHASASSSRLPPRRTSGTAARSAPVIANFGGVVDYLASRRAIGKLQFPGGNGPKDFQVEGWIYMHFGPLEHMAQGGKGGKHADRPGIFSNRATTFFARRSGNRFVMLVNLYNREMLYFCAAGNRKLAVLVPLLGGGPILWTDEGGARLVMVARSTPHGGELEEGVGYSGRPPAMNCRVDEGAMLTSAAGRCNVMDYNAFRNFLAGTRCGAHRCSWVVARFNQPPAQGVKLPLEIAALQYGGVSSRGRGIAGMDAIILRQTPVKRDMAYFRTSPIGLGSIGGRLIKINGRKMSLAMVVAQLKNQPQSSTGHRAGVIPPFLRWVGGSAVARWYRSSNTKYVRVTTLASMAAFAKAWNAAKQRLRKGFTFIPPAVR